VDDPFVDPLYERSADDSDTGWGELRPIQSDDARDEDARYEDDRPPHWEP